jgi:hypothetical protein
MADVEIERAHANTRRITVTVLDGQFGPLPAKEVTLFLGNTAAGIEPLRLPSLTGTTRQPRRSTHPGENSAGWGIGPTLAAREQSETRSMSGDGRCARAEQRGV